MHASVAGTKPECAAGSYRATICIEHRRLEEKKTSQFVGYSRPWFPEGWPAPEAGWGLLKTAQRKGFATEASLRGFKTLISFIDLRNVASRAVAERLGAKYERSAMLFD